jgi:trafficking protein particle complex subunit 5
MAAPPAANSMAATSIPGPQQLVQNRQPTQYAGTSNPGLRVPLNRKTIYDRNLNRSRNAELNRSSFAFLFMEMVIYAQKRVTGIQDLEKRLNEQGYPLGHKLLDLLLYRASPAGSTSSSTAPAARPLRLLPLLTLLTTKLYPLLFSRPADSLEQSTTNPAEYMIIDNTPLTNQYISVPKEMNQLSVAAYIAGIIEGVCDGAGFECKASAHNTGTDMWPNRTVFLIKFEEYVLEREKELEKQGVK